MLFYVVADICILIFDIFEEIGGNKSLKSKYLITAIIAIFLLLVSRITHPPSRMPGIGTSSKTYPRTVFVKIYTTNRCSLPKRES